MSSSPPPDPDSWPPRPPARPHVPAGGATPPSWDQLFELDDTRRPAVRGTERKVGRKVALGVAGAAIVLAVVALIVFVTRPAAGNHDESGSTPTASNDAATSGAQARLVSLLPPGYTPASCKPEANPVNTLASVSCVRNADPGGPVTAQYTLVKDKAALDAAFSAVVKASTTVECPGRIQSPGPWRRNATPQQISGTLFCGIQENRPFVAWTDDVKLVLNEVHADAQGPTLAQLYLWWSSHS
jgi:hypothetical protein